MATWATWTGRSGNVDRADRVDDRAEERGGGAEWRRGRGRQGGWGGNIIF